MKKIIQNSVLGLVISLGLVSPVFAYTMLTSQLDLGDRGDNVTNLQTYLADNPSWYPEGLVTGYFGGLTRTGVKRFQATYGFEQVGRLGPASLAKINELMGGTPSTGDISGPAFYNVNLSKSTNSSTLTFNTNEGTTARVVYKTVPLKFNEGDINSVGFGAVGSYDVISSNGINSSHSLTMQNLYSNTDYYYTIIATDAAGNVSVVGPNNKFRTQ